MTPALLLGLSLSLSAQAAPPEFVTAPGLETICAASDELDPNEDSISSSAVYLADQAELDMDAVAAATGQIRTDAPARVGLSGETVVFAARTKGIGIGYVDFDMILLNTPAKLTLGTTSAEIAEGTMLHASHSAIDGITTTAVTIYNADGKATDKLSSTSRSTDSNPVEAILLIDNGTGLDGIAVVFMYGDIIMGSLPLDDFYD